MVALFCDSILLLFITAGVGLLTRRLLEKVFRSPVSTDLFGIFLLGLIASTFYFNIFSLFGPVNALSLIPLGLVSGIVFRKDIAGARGFRQSLRSNIRDFFSPAHCLLAISLLGLLFIESMLPPRNGDGTLYHYQCILWYEKFKVVPGLANLHDRFGFNPASFIIEAAYSLTALTGQSLYPLNGALNTLLLFWLLSQLIKAPNRIQSWTWFLLILLLCGPLLADQSSATSDVIVTVTSVYSFISLAKLFSSGSFSFSRALVPVLVLFYAVMAKLSAIPLLFALPIIFLLLPKEDRKMSRVAKIAVIVVVLFLPWLARNYILSGYLVFPIPHTNLGHPDWQVPPGLLRYELYMINRYSKTDPHFLPYSQPLPLSRWLPLWLHFNGSYVKNLALICLAMISPLSWLVIAGRKRRPPRGLIVLWIAAYINVWIWFFGDSQLRFASTPVILTLTMPLLAYVRIKSAGNRKPYGLWLKLAFFLCVFHYARLGLIIQSSYPSGFKHCWLLPLKDLNYTLAPAQVDTFRYRVLNTGVKLYLGDSKHDCINSALPCTYFIYGRVEMRGSRLDQGFRITKDSTLDYFPYLK